MIYVNLVVGICLCKIRLRDYGLKHKEESRMVLNKDKDDKIAP